MSYNFNQAMKEVLRIEGVTFIQSSEIAMKLKTNAEWVEWGRRDPLFGVASWADKQAKGAAPWKDYEFYALGESDWRDFELHWRAYRYTQVLL